MLRARSLTIAAALLVGITGIRPVIADDQFRLLPDEPSAEQVDRVDQLRPAFLFDRGALAFLWAPAIGTVLVDRYYQPRSSPLLFSQTEGGAPSLRHHEIPGAALSIGSAAIVGAIAFGDDPSRFYHAKGMAQSLLTSGFITVTAKRIFGRHRPDYDMAGSPLSEARSFPSGHTTRAFSSLVYAGLYLRYHGFDQWREPGTLPWWEIASYASLGGLAVALGGERVIHNRHHLSDVVAGGLLGTASSVAFFYYQERRYRSANRERSEFAGEPRPVVDPVSERNSRHASPVSEAPVFSFSGSF